MDIPKQWFIQPHEKSQDPLKHIVHVSFDEIEPRIAWTEYEVFFDSGEDIFHDAIGAVFKDTVNKTCQINQCNVICLFSKSKIQQSREGASVDCGENGGHIRSDAHPKLQTGQRADVQGVNNHQVTHIPVVTAVYVDPVLLLMS